MPGRGERPTRRRLRRRRSGTGLKSNNPTHRGWGTKQKWKDGDSPKKRIEHKETRNGINWKKLDGAVLDGAETF